MRRRFAQGRPHNQSGCRPAAPLGSPDRPRAPGSASGPLRAAGTGPPCRPVPPARRPLLPPSSAPAALVATPPAGPRPTLLRLIKTPSPGVCFPINVVCFSVKNTSKIALTVCFTVNPRLLVECAATVMGMWFWQFAMAGIPMCFIVNPSHPLVFHGTTGERRHPIDHGNDFQARTSLDNSPGITEPPAGRPVPLDCVAGTSRKVENWSRTSESLR